MAANSLDTSNLSDLYARQVASLADWLRNDEMEITPAQCLRAHMLMVRLTLNGRLPETAERLAAMLGPIFCTSSGEQARFLTIFRWWWRTEIHDVEKSVESDIEPRREIAPDIISRFWSRLPTVAVAASGIGAWVAFATAIVLLASLLRFLISRNLWLWIFPFALVPVVFLVIWGAWQWWRGRNARFVLRRVAVASSDQLTQVRLSRGAHQLLPEFKIPQLIREMRTREFVPSNELDIRATIASTLHTGGLLTPIFGSRIEPDYILLINRASLIDHQANLADLLAESLIVGNVSVDRWYFDGETGRCQRSMSPAAAKSLEVLELEELAGRFPSHKVLMFTSVDQLFGHYDGRPRNWVEVFQRWKDVAVITPLPSDRWGMSERTVESFGIPLLPLSVCGLSALPSVLRGHVTRTFRNFNERGESGATFANATLRWLDREPPLPSAIELLCEDLLADLGADGFRWLTACALYPDIIWGLTIRLGATLIPQTHRFEELLPLIARLPWFRKGFMPDWLRVELVQRIGRDEQIRVRSALINILARSDSIDFPDDPLYVRAVEVNEVQNTVLRRTYARLRAYLNEFLFLGKVDLLRRTNERKTRPASTRHGKSPAQGFGGVLSAELPQSGDAIHPSITATHKAASLSAEARRSLRIYNLFFPLVFLVLLPGFFLRMLRRGSFREKFAQRLGRYTPEERQRFANGAWLWLHSISVGETLLALKLARQMRVLDPATNIALSVTTTTGFAVAREAACEWLEVLYNPLDMPGIVRPALDVVRPRRLIFLEAIWPNLLAEARRRGLPVAFLPRLSPRSENRFRRASSLTGPIFRLIDVLAVQEPEDVARWQSLGVDPSRIRVTGNTKFDYGAAGGERAAEFRTLLRQLGVADDAPVLLGGSTFPEEELILAKIYRELRGRFPSLFLILVPRHVERTRQVLADLRPLDLRVALRTDEVKTPADVLVVNTTGELRDWYHLATVVFIGKSLAAHGGQNPVEPVLAGKPVVYGPYMENFGAIVTRWREEEAAVQVRDETELQDQLADLLANASRRETLARRAKEIVTAHFGAAERTARVLLGMNP